MKTNSFLLVAIFGFALAFTFSCSSGGDDDSDGGLFNVNPQIYNEDGTIYNGNGIMDVTSYVGGSCSNDECTWEWDQIRAGSVTNGIVNLNLSIGSPDEYLEDFLPESSGFDCSAYPKGIKWAGGFFVLTDNNGEYIGKLKVTHWDGQIEESIVYWYFSKTGKITCNRSEYDENGDGTVYKDNRIIDIDVKQGWNNIYYRSSRTVGVNTVERNAEWSTKNILTKEVKWEIH